MNNDHDDFDGMKNGEWIVRKVIQKEAQNPQHETIAIPWHHILNNLTIQGLNKSSVQTLRMLCLQTLLHLSLQRTVDIHTPVLPKPISEDFFERLNTILMLIHRLNASKGKSSPWQELIKQRFPQYNFFDDYVYRPLFSTLKEHEQWSFSIAQLGRGNLRTSSSLGSFVCQDLALVFTDEPFQRILRLSHVTRLSLENCGLSQHHLHLLSKAPFWTTLVYLSLARNQGISRLDPLTRSLKYGMGSTSPMNLRFLSLAGLRKLTKESVHDVLLLPQLEEIDLTGSPVGCNWGQLKLTFKSKPSNHIQIRDFKSPAFEHAQQTDYEGVQCINAQCVWFGFKREAYNALKLKSEDVMHSSSNPGIMTCLCGNGNNHHPKRKPRAHALIIDDDNNNNNGHGRSHSGETRGGSSCSHHDKFQKWSRECSPPKNNRPESEQMLHILYRKDPGAHAAILVVQSNKGQKDNTEKPGTWIEPPLVNQKDSHYGTSIDELKAVLMIETEKEEETDYHQNIPKATTVETRPFSSLNNALKEDRRMRRITNNSHLHDRDTNSNEALSSGTAIEGMTKSSNVKTLGLIKHHVGPHVGGQMTIHSYFNKDTTTH